MYLKFGFGRANQDACIDIRRGALSRDQAVQLVKMYDNQIPTHLFDEYCEYYKISKKRFYNILDKWANKRLFKKSVNFGIQNYCKMMSINKNIKLLLLITNLEIQLLLRTH